jgi:PPOX class probable F420-dependent enzyme
MTPDEARAAFGGARIARLATADAGGRPHVVPVTFALLDDATIVSAVDHKPKRTTALKRLANVEANPQVAILADHYSDDWTQLWWARADGTATVTVQPSPAVLDALAARYEPYRERPPDGPFLVVGVERWSGWRASAPQRR